MFSHFYIMFSFHPWLTCQKLFRQHESALLGIFSHRHTQHLALSYEYSINGDFDIER